MSMPQWAGKQSTYQGTSISCPVECYANKAFPGLESPGLGRGSGWIANPEQQPRLWNHDPASLLPVFVQELGLLLSY